MTAVKSERKLKLVRELVTKNVKNPTICCTTPHFTLDYLDFRR